MLSRYWYLKLREELTKLGATPTQLDQGTFIWSKINKPISIMACFGDNVLWGGNAECEIIINKLKQVFHIETEHKQIFEYISIKLEQTSDFSINITQKDYINNIFPVTLTQDDYKNPKQTVANRNTRERGILG